MATILTDKAEILGLLRQKATEMESAVEKLTDECRVLSNTVAFSGKSQNYSEVFANFTLAIRHFEDALCRIAMAVSHFEHQAQKLSKLNQGEE